MSETHQAIAEELGLAELLQPGDWVQGELVGPKIQGNLLGLDKVRLLVFAVQAGERTEEVTNLLAGHMVPRLDLPFPATVAEAINQADGLRSVINPLVLAEGIVWWEKNGQQYQATGNRPNFKVINNSWLVKNKR